MISYRLDYTIEMLTSTEAVLQGLLEAYTKRVIPKSETKKVWVGILDHKWYLSERLGRDVGMRVAAVDYVENLYEPSRPLSGDTWLSAIDKWLSSAGSWLKSHFNAITGLTS